MVIKGKHKNISPEENLESILNANAGLPNWRQIIRRPRRRVAIAYYLSKPNLWAEGNTAKQIAGQFRPSIAESTIYKWVKEFKNLSAQSLLAIYEEDGLPELIIEKWKSYNIHNPNKIREFDELRRLQVASGVPNQDEDKESIIAPPHCFEKNEWGCCSNAGLRSDCGLCFYLRIGRTQEEIDRLIDSSLNLPAKVQRAKKEFLERDNRNNGD